MTLGQTNKLSIGFDTYLEVRNSLMREIKERDELIKSGISYMTKAHLIFTPNVTNSLALDWVEKAKKLVGDK